MTWWAPVSTFTMSQLTLNHLLSKHGHCHIQENSVTTMCYIKFVVPTIYSIYCILIRILSETYVRKLNCNNYSASLSNNRQFLSVCNS